MWRMGERSHEWIHEGRENGTAAEDDHCCESQQENDQRYQPPFLFLFQKQKELFAKLPHAGLVYSFGGTRGKCKWE
jgi:hypothetical protein